MIILKEEYDEINFMRVKNLNSNMIILKETVAMNQDFTSSRFKFQYDNT